MNAFQPGALSRAVSGSGRCRRLSRQRGDRAQTAGGDRRQRPVLSPERRQRPSQPVRRRPAADRALRGGPRARGGGLNAPSGKDIVWTRGTTEAINMVAQSYVRPRLQPGDEIIVSEAGASCQPRALADGSRADRRPSRQTAAWRRPTAGYRQPQRASSPAQPGAGHRPDVQRHRRLPGPGAGYPPCSRRRDGSDGRWRPGSGAFPADVQALDIDFYAFSGHKLYGPTGIGALYGKSELLAAMSPWLGGGKMIAEVSFDGFTPQPAPYGLEAGTPNVAGVIGLSAAPGVAGAERYRPGGKLEPQSGESGGRGAGETAGLPLPHASSQACWPLSSTVFITAIW